MGSFWFKIHVDFVLDTLYVMNSYEVFSTYKHLQTNLKNRPFRAKKITVGILHTKKAHAASLNGKACAHVCLV